ncbi:UPF0262 family protein [Dongia soli]|uniref:UPF0262 protein SMD27_07045 n=1 Tax=Dongia soli TaxID=600628 RepID=A0ABU5E8Q3_9PROT|nr:UPF0262 family protein [Dongia soli]MDY0882593.1 UPF0262 family protein [Dongia soli]
MAAGSDADNIATSKATQCIVKIQLDEDSTARRSPEVENERAVAIFDLIEENQFVPAIEHQGPYHLILSIEENRLVFDIRDTGDQELYRFILSLAPLRRIVKEYLDICSSYYAAIRRASPSQIEAIDMGRRGLHNEGSEVLRDRLAGKVEMDTNTARRLFTLICTLYFRT